ncbi:MAG: hypothetical protein ACQCN3_02555 [Candidatus Bathyarchaeia archaeon]|jgi:hypothetical protein
MTRHTFKLLEIKKRLFSGAFTHIATVELESGKKFKVLSYAPKDYAFAENIAAQVEYELAKAERLAKHVVGFTFSWEA